MALGTWSDRDLEDCLSRSSGCIGEGGGWSEFCVVASVAAAVGPGEGWEDGDRGCAVVEGDGVAEAVEAGGVAAWTGFPAGTVDHWSLS